MTAVTWAPESIRDVESIRAFIAQDSPAYAELVAHRIVAAVERPRTFPESGRIVPLHLLGYLVDPTDAALLAECAAIRESRVARAQRMVEAMAADGHPVSWKRVAARAAKLRT